MLSKPYGGLDLRLDPWEADYGSEIPLPPDPDAAREGVDLSVERPPASWAPVEPAPASRLPPRVVFVDGVRRVEARVVARKGGRLAHGAFGSYGVGAAVCEGGRARVEELHVERVLALDSGQSLP